MNQQTLELKKKRDIRVMEPPPKVWPKLSPTHQNVILKRYYPAGKAAGQKGGENFLHSFARQRRNMFCVIPARTEAKRGLPSPPRMIGLSILHYTSSVHMWEGVLSSAFCSAPRLSLSPF
jgi:hypothetical protein